MKILIVLTLSFSLVFGNVISEAEGRFYRNLEQYTGKLKDFFGGFEVIQCFQIGKETDELFGSCVKDVEESRYHSRFCASSGEVFALSLTYGTLFFQILFCAWTAAKGKVSANAMLYRHELQKREKILQPAVYQMHRSLVPVPLHRKSKKRSRRFFLTKVIS